MASVPYKIIDTSGFKDSPAGQFFSSTGGLDDDARKRLFSKKTAGNPVPLPAASQPAIKNQPGPAQLAAAESAPAAATRLSATSPTIAKTAGGGVSVFGRDGRAIDPASLAGKMGKVGSLQRDMTGQASADNKVFEMAMARAKDGTLPKGFSYFSPPGQPGGGTYAPDSRMTELQSRRDLIQSRIDDYNSKNALRPGASVGEIISRSAATKQMRDEVKNLDTQIFGRSDLANKIQMAIIDSITKKEIGANANLTELEKQNMENQGLFDIHKMRENAETLRTGMQINAGQYSPKSQMKDYDTQGYMDLLKAGGAKQLEVLLQSDPNMDSAAFLKNYWTKATGSSSVLKRLLESEQ